MDDKTLFAAKANSRQKAVEEALLNLCRRGVLILGYEDDEPTYQVTKEFGQSLNNCNDVLLQVGGYGLDPMGGLAWLALLSWYGDLDEKTARNLWEALVGVLRASLEGST